MKKTLSTYVDWVFLKIGGIVKYTNINEAYINRYRFATEYTEVTVKDSDPVWMVKSVYNHIGLGKINSKKTIAGLKTNKLIVKRPVRYKPVLTRMDDGSLNLLPNSYNSNKLKVENGIIIDNKVLGYNDKLNVKYGYIDLDIPKQVDAKSSTTNYKGYVYDNHGYIIESDKLMALQNFIIVVYSKDEYEQYFDVLSNFSDYTIINLHGKHDYDKEINLQDITADDIVIYLSKESLAALPLENTCIVPKKIQQFTHHLDNAHIIEDVVKLDDYQFEHVPQRQVYAIDCENIYSNAIHVDSLYDISLNDGVLIFEDIKLAYKYIDFFKGNKIIINNDKSYLDLLNYKNIVEYGNNIINGFDDVELYAQRLKEVKINYSFLDYKGDKLIYSSGKKLNLCNYNNPIFTPGDNSLTYVFDNDFEFHHEGSDRAIEIEVEAHKQKYSSEYQYSILGSKIFKSSNANICYVYDMKQTGDVTKLYILEAGFRDYEHEYSLVCDYSWSKRANPEHSQFYSPYAKYFPNNFYIYNVEGVDFEFSMIDSNCDVPSLRYMKKLSDGIIHNDCQITRIDKQKMDVKPISQIVRSEYELEMEKKTDAYMFVDRGWCADDNAEHMYRYYMNIGCSKPMYYILSKESSDWDRLEKEGFNLVEYKSALHKELFLTAEKILTSHFADVVFNPFSPSKKYRYLQSGKIIFLQHGVMVSTYNGFLDKYSMPADLFISGAIEEGENIRKISKYENVAVTGLARYDALKGNHDGYILYAPSWHRKYRDSFQNSDYHIEVQKVLDSPVINKLLSDAGVKLKLLLHPVFIDKAIYFKDNENVEIYRRGEANYSELLSNANMLITDYSSLFFDFLYQRKNVIRHMPYEITHDDSALTMPDQYVYKTFDLKQLEDTLTEFAKDDFKAQNIHNVDKFFGQVDKNNCKRIYEEIEKL